MVTVYLSGPIASCTDDEVHYWREELKSLTSNIEWFDPTDRDYREADSSLAAKIVLQDKDDILESDVVVANCWKPGWGTGMEILFCYEAGIPVISIVPAPKEDASPWILHHSVFVVETVEEAADLLRDWYPRRNRWK